MLIFYGLNINSDVNLLTDISFANWSLVQHFQRGNALVSKLISSVYKNKICTELFENLTKKEKAHLRAKYRSTYTGLKMQKTVMAFICGICEECIAKGYNMGTHKVGFVEKKTRKKENQMTDIYLASKTASGSFESQKGELQVC